MKTLLFIEGRFGQAVAAKMMRDVLDLNVTVLSQLTSMPDAAFADVEFVGVATWRPYEALSAALGETLGRLGRAWSTATIEGTVLRQGPLIGPRRQPCYSCFRKRSLTHLAQLEQERVLSAEFERDSRAGLAGFLPSVVALAVAGLRLDHADRAHSAGRVRYVDVLGCNVEETSVVRVHGCSSCAPNEHHANRFVEHLVPELERGLFR